MPLRASRHIGDAVRKASAGRPPVFRTLENAGLPDNRVSPCPPAAGAGPDSHGHSDPHRTVERSSDEKKAPPGSGGA